MTRQPALARRAEELLGSAVIATAPVAGGDICTANRLRLSDGRVVLIKTHPHPPEGFFEAEARGLGWLRVDGGVPVPEVLAVDHDCVIAALAGRVAPLEHHDHPRTLGHRPGLQPGQLDLKLVELLLERLARQLEAIRGGISLVIRLVLLVLLGHTAPLLSAGKSGDIPLPELAMPGPPLLPRPAGVAGGVSAVATATSGMQSRSTWFRVHSPRSRRG